MDIKYIEKRYLTKGEAIKLRNIRGIKRLPSIGKEIWTVKSNYEKAITDQWYDVLIGKDNIGYYTAKAIVE